MAGQNDKFGAKEVVDATLYDMETGRPVIFFNTLKTSEIAFTSEKVYARGGKGNPKLLTWELNKDGILTITDALLSPKSLELASGIRGASGTKKIHMRQATQYSTDTIPVDKGASYPLSADTAGKITLAFEPNEAAAEILVYELDDDAGTPLAMTGATLVDKELTIEAAKDKKVVVYYTYMSSADTETYVIDASHFSGTYKLVGDTVIRNLKTGKDEAFQLVIPNLKWSSNLTLSFAAEGDPSIQTYECEILRSPDGSTMLEMIRYV